MQRTEFHIREIGRSEREVRVAVSGELDLETAAAMAARLKEYREQNLSVRLELSRLDFIDSTGIHVLIDAAQKANEDRLPLSIEPTMREHVSRVLKLVGADHLLSAADPPADT